MNSWQTKLNSKFKYNAGEGGVGGGGG